MKTRYFRSKLGDTFAREYDYYRIRPRCRSLEYLWSRGKNKNKQWILEYTYNTRAEAFMCCENNNSWKEITEEEITLALL